MKTLSRKILKLAEFLFLKAYGWTYLGKDKWKPPEWYDEKKKGREYRGGHAVNSLKYYLFNGVQRQGDLFDGD